MLSKDAKTDSDRAGFEPPSLWSLVPTRPNKVAPSLHLILFKTHWLNLHLLPYYYVWKCFILLLIDINGRHLMPPEVLKKIASALCFKISFCLKKRSHFTLEFNILIYILQQQQMTAWDGSFHANAPLNQDPDSRPKRHVFPSLFDQCMFPFPLIPFHIFKRSQVSELLGHAMNEFPPPLPFTTGWRRLNRFQASARSVPGVRMRQGIEDFRMLLFYFFSSAQLVYPRLTVKR